eukprot:TRINITY_DN509_c0_g1_i5.p1 TRINITY_DN509_c0_g1~~TRINITY_DN509_c0_g1_i5.p1  ORF type:complete len:1273 (-),score=278.82 TRINITY_DN509_c0_g1_i5:103-3897(-)
MDDAAAMRRSPAEVPTRLAGSGRAAGSPSAAPTQQRTHHAAQSQSPSQAPHTPHSHVHAHSSGSRKTQRGSHASGTPPNSPPTPATSSAPPLPPSPSPSTGEPPPNAEAPAATGEVHGRPHSVHGKRPVSMRVGESIRPVTFTETPTASTASASPPSHRQRTVSLGSAAEDVTIAAAVPSVLFGSPLGAVLDSPKHAAVPHIVTRCVEFLRVTVKTIDGVFIVAPSDNTKVDQLRDTFEQGFRDRKEVDIPYTTECHAVAALLKLYLSSLPVLLLTSGTAGLAPFYEAADIEDTTERTKAVQEAAKQLPQESYDTLASVCGLLKAMVGSPLNRPRLPALSQLFTTIWCGGEMSPEQKTQLAKVVSMLIRNGVTQSVADVVARVQARTRLQSGGSGGSREELLLLPPAALVERLLASQARIRELESEVTKLKQELRNTEGERLEMLGAIDSLQKLQQRQQPPPEKDATQTPVTASPTSPPKGIHRRSKSAGGGGATEARNKLHANVRSATDANSAALPSPRDGDEPSSYLHVKIVSAANLPPSDPNGFSDPYVLLKIAGQKFRSRTEKKTLNPVWNEVTSFSNVLGSDVLTVEVWDWDKLSSDDFLGLVEIPLVSLLDGKQRECRYVLAGNKDEDQKTSGDIHLLIAFSPKAVPPAFEKVDAHLRPLVHLGMTQLIVEVIEAKDIKPGVHATLVMHADSQKVKSEVIETPTTSPAWNKTFYFEVTSKSVFELSLCDHTMMNKYVPVGTLTVPVETLPPDEQQDEWLPLTPAVKGDKVAGSLHVKTLLVSPSNIPEQQISFSEFFQTDSDWSTPCKRKEQWTDPPPIGPSSLFDTSCLSSGYRIEDSRACVTSLTCKDALRQPDFDKRLTFPHYAQCICGTEHAIYYTETSSTPIIVVISGHTESGTRRVLVLTKKEERRFIVPDTQGYLRAIRAACPILMSVKMHRAKLRGKQRPHKPTFESNSLLLFRTSAVQDSLAQLEQRTIVKRHKFGVLYAAPHQRTEQELLQNNKGSVQYEHFLEQRTIVKRHKFGVLYAAPHQRTEQELLQNNKGSVQYEHFLELLGEKVKLEGWTQYRGGLDTQKNTSGTHSIYTTYEDIEIMYHVATLIPSKPSDPQQIDRKKHVGNDIVAIIFKDRADANDTVDVSSFLTNFTHVFFCISPALPSDDVPVEGQPKKEQSPRAPAGVERYRIQVCHKTGLQPYPPFLKESPALYIRSETLRHFLMQKLINSERAAMETHAFLSKLVVSRKAVLHDIVETCRQNPHQ